MKPKKSELLVEEVEHIDIKQHNVVPLVDALSKMQHELLTATKMIVKAG